jgi:hypothetical protein
MRRLVAAACVLPSVAAFVVAACSSDPASHPPPPAGTGTSTHAATTGAGGGGAGGSGGSGGAAACTDGGECPSGVCTVDGLCAEATCQDGVENGDESAVDCGGKCASKCADGATCNGAADCQSDVCLNGKCAKPACDDNVKNGNESDKDCGGSCSAKCDLGQQCSTATDCGSKTCVQAGALQTCACPVGMTIIPVAMGGQFCIDRTEVSYAQYNQFWQANPNVGQAAYCGWNASFTPSEGWPPTPAQMGNPVVHVDWCDAAAYCQWRGKHLCGAILGGSNGYADYTDAGKSEWFDACTAEGQYEYPYGHAYDANRCVGVDSGNSGPVAVTDQQGTKVEDSPCAGGAADLYHMSGNVAEWEDSCDAQAGTSDSCRVRGGSYESGQTDLLCGADASLTRGGSSATVGFRCCL